jgi:hypothetical protein
MDVHEGDVAQRAQQAYRLGVAAVVQQLQASRQEGQEREVCAQVESMGRWGAGRSRVAAD